MWPFGAAYPEVQISDSKFQEQYDYVIIGGGTAGCVLANRLSADLKSSVLIVERGPLADSWVSGVPLLSSDFASDGSRTLKRPTEFQHQLNRPLEFFSGGALGGSTRINQMIYTRGLPAEYDAWAEAGRKGWAWAELKPYFLKSERATYICNPNVHGNNGEWYNCTTDKFHFAGTVNSVSACRELGLPYINDINSPQHPSIGCAQFHYTRSPYTRHSTYHAFLPKKIAVERKDNLHVCTNTLVERLELETLPGGSCSVQKVILSAREGGPKKIVWVRKEAIICAGPLASPQILMLSGIGPERHLVKHGIEVVRNIPAVGSNLQDHFGVSVGYTVPMADSLVALEKRPWMFFIELFRYLVFGTGVLLAPVVQVAIFASSFLLDERGVPQKREERESPAAVLPDIEIMPMSYDSSDTAFDKSLGRFSFLNVLIRPKSKGTIRLTSNDPRAPLSIDPNYLEDSADLVPLRASLKLTLRIRDKIRASGYPLEDWEVPQGEDDAALDAFIKKRNRTTYHYSSTCRMAPENDSEGGGVVDDELFVHGVRNLRVADSSIFPSVPGTHLQAPTVAVAEKCADMILQRYKSQV